MSTPAHRRDRQRGFTLIEIMVVVVIIGLLATIVVPNLLASGETAKIKKAQADVRVIADTIKQYILLNNVRDLPTMEQLTTKDEKGNVAIETSSKDPWGNDYDIKRGDKLSDFEVVSAGPDGLMGTEDDISSRKFAEGKH